MPNALPKPLVKEIQNYAQNIVDTIRKPLLILDAALRVRSANRAFFQTFQVSAAETEGRLIYELGNGQWNIPELRTLLEDIIPKNSVFDDFELEHTFPTIGRRFMLLNARRLRAGQHDELIVLATEDVTARMKAEENLIKAGALQNAIFNSANFSSIATDEKGVIQIFNVGAERMLGYEAAGCRLARYRATRSEWIRSCKADSNAADAQECCPGCANWLWTGIGSTSFDGGWIQSSPNQTSTTGAS